MPEPRTELAHPLAEDFDNRRSAHTHPRIRIFGPPWAWACPERSAGIANQLSHFWRVANRPTPQGERTRVVRTVVPDPSSHPLRGATTELEWRPLRRAAASTRPLEKAPVRVERSRREKSCKRHAAERLRVDSRCLPGDLRIDKPSSACCCTFKAGWYVDREDEEGARNIKILAAKLMRC